MEATNCSSYCEDQRVGDDFIDELIRKYLHSEDTNSLYEDESFPAFASSETDKWLGEIVFPDLTCSKDCLVPESLLLDDRVKEPDEELLSILEEIISEDETKNEGACKPTPKDTSASSSVLENKAMTPSKSTPISQEAQTNRRKRPMKTSLDKKGKRPCRSQPIILKRRAKQRMLEE
ncbi:uncharacterized protein [Montipora capricornis]|uniref:uncharacterized protein isoform X2 n=1 Tax=Montipora capricornis TaxID=246305 RepID=UPI0035F1B94A